MLRNVQIGERRYVKRILAWALIVAAVCACLAGSCLATVLKTTESGIQFIKSHEGFSARKYWDYSQYSIGYGTSCGAWEYPNGITVEQADALLRGRLVKMEASLDAFLEKNQLQLSPAQYDALMSFTYNVGTSWMSGCRLSRMLIQGNFTESDFASALGVWCHAGKRIHNGLVLRRIREIQLFLYEDYTGTGSKAYNYVIYDPGGGTADADIFYYPAGDAYGSLPSAFMSKREFIGWFTPQGIQLLDTDIVAENLTVTARWQNPRPACEVFSDIQQETWYYTYIDELYNNSVIRGYSDNTFRPEGDVTLGEALKLVLLACGNTEQSATDFHWASGYRTLALNKGYLTEAELQDLDVPISRALVAKIVAAAMGITAEPRGNVFSDTSAGYVIGLYDAGILQGTPDESGNMQFHPHNTITRCEISAILYRILTM